MQGIVRREAQSADLSGASKLASGYRKSCLRIVQHFGHLPAAISIEGLLNLVFNGLTATPMPLTPCHTTKDKQHGLGLKANLVLRKVIKGPAESAHVQIHSDGHAGAMMVEMGDWG